MKQYIAIDIGGTSIKHGVMDETLHIVTSDECPTNASLGGPHIMNKIISIIKNYQTLYSVDGIAVSTAGMVNPDKGEITYASELIPNYTGTKIKEIIETAFHLPCEVENDVNCAGLSEARLGAGHGTKSSLCLTVGTGIGGCIILENRIYHGASMSACEVGYLHIPGGVFQDLGATTALVRRVAEKKGCSPSEINGKLIFEGAKQNDTICIEAIDEMVDVLGQGIANICYVLNPEIVILGGGIMAQQEYLKDRIEKSLDKYLIPAVRKHTRIAFAKNQNQAGMLGACLNFMDKHSV